MLDFIQERIIKVSQGLLPNIMVATPVRKKSVTPLQDLNSPGKHVLFPPGLRLENVIIPGLEVDEARNKAFELFIQSGADFLFFLDDDVCLPAEGLLNLYYRLLDVVSKKGPLSAISGYYMLKSELMPQPVFQNIKNRKLETLQAEDSALIKCNWLMSMGCCLMTRELVKSVMDYSRQKGQKSFLTSEHEEKVIAEDIYFFQKALYLDANLYTDPMTPCLHYCRERKKIFYPYNFQNYEYRYST